MSNNNGRKVSDVVLKLENDVGLLKKYVQNINNELKILISNNNITNQAIEKLLSNLNKAPINRPTVSAPDETPSLKQTSPKPEVIDFIDDDRIEEAPVIKKGKQRSQRKKVDSIEDHQVAVSQKILLSDGKPLFLADVSIYDQNGDFIRKARTNAQGKWLAALKPGNTYFIVVQKKTANKKPIELRYDVDLPAENDGKPIELPPRELDE